MESNFSAASAFLPFDWANYQTALKSALNGFQQFEAINTKLTEKFMQKNAAFFNSAVATSNQMFALYSDGKALPEALNEHAKVATEFTAQIFDYWREAGELFTSVGDEYRK